jgi:hypothetical protein
MSLVEAAKNEQVLHLGGDQAGLLPEFATHGLLRWLVPAYGPARQGPWRTVTPDKQDPIVARANSRSSLSHSLVWSGQGRSLEKPIGAATATEFRLQEAEEKLLRRE